VTNRDGDPRPPSPLELLHADGFVRGSLVLGGGCPQALRSFLPDRDDELADLVVLAPTRAEALDRKWVCAAADSAASTLRPDGFVYVLAAARRRRALLRALAAVGLEREATLIHLPHLESSRHLVSAERRALRYALANLLVRRSRRGRLAAAVAAFPGGALPFRLLEGTGVVARRPGGRPLFEWLLQLTPDADNSCAIVTRTWRETGGSCIVHVFTASAAAPVAVAKIRSPPKDHGGDREERFALEGLAVAARVSDVDTPAPLATALVGGRTVLLETALEGPSAAAILADRPRQVPVVLGRVAAWLESWNRATLVPDAFASDEIEALLLDLARFVGAHIPDADAYESWLRELCRRLGQARVPAVAAHNDLTMTNVLIGRHGRLGIVDWESADSRSLPLRDLSYATVDAYTAARQYASRTTAFESCFLRDGPEAETAQRQLARHRDALELGPAAVAACFHACWLGHAANDVLRGDAETSEFVEIVRRVACRRDALGLSLARS
jgi:hypothetical protein